MHADGKGLYLQVRPGVGDHSRSWIYRYTVDGKQRWMGLGVFPDVTLARAREKALAARRLRAEGLDPLAQKRAVRASLSREQAQSAARLMTFQQCVDGYFTAHVQHGRQGTPSLDAHDGNLRAADHWDPACQYD
jgi:hypothetical protein